MNDEIKVPLIKKVEPISSELFGVQPMAAPTAEIFTLKYVDAPKVFEFGEVIHSFTEGWMIYDGEKFVTPEEFKKRFPEENISLEES